MFSFFTNAARRLCPGKVVRNQCAYVTMLAGKSWKSRGNMWLCARARLVLVQSEAQEIIRELLC
jgi:hypothetical protein